MLRRQYHDQQADPEDAHQFVRSQMVITKTLKGATNTFKERKGEQCNVHITVTIKFWRGDRRNQDGKHTSSNPCISNSSVVNKADRTMLMNSEMSKRAALQINKAIKC